MVGYPPPLPPKGKGKSPQRLFPKDNSGLFTGLPEETGNGQSAGLFGGLSWDRDAPPPGLPPFPLCRGRARNPSCKTYTACSFCRRSWSRTPSTSSRCGQSRPLHTRERGVTGAPSPPSRPHTRVSPHTLLCLPGGWWGPAVQARPPDPKHLLWALLPARAAWLLLSYPVIFTVLGTQFMKSEGPAPQLHPDPQPGFRGLPQQQAFCTS